MAERTETGQPCGVVLSVLYAACWSKSPLQVVPNFSQDEEDEEESDNEDSEDEHEAALECDPEHRKTATLSCANGAFLHFMSFRNLFMALFHEEYDLNMMIKTWFNDMGIMPSCLHNARIGSR